MQAWITLAAAAVLGLALIYLLFIVPSKWLKIEHVHHSLGLGVRILQISDLHVDMLRITPLRIQEIIARCQPDFILLTGDYTYKASYLPRLNTYLSAMHSSLIPTYAVLGNHDHDLPSLKQLRNLFKEHHVALLQNAAVELESFWLVGIDNFSTGHSRVEKAFRRLPREPGKKVIVMTHDPNIVLSMKRPYSYLMAGHLHGKQLNIPYFYKLKPKGPLPALGIYKGLHHHKWGTYYISKGIGQAGVNARFMVRSEVTVHDL
ncbi:metallophosphoesterase [Paenibacillus sp. HB172176]|uniref:metallophosphoesterase n=1 Tax=Paenibacillus sp. HB172176 TaxID=2493690 RepID=UPI001F0EA0FA|nr:metallophosphoesterase [Paenibacillus sp. HB172176]